MDNTFDKELEARSTILSSNENQHWKTNNVNILLCYTLQSAR